MILQAARTSPRLGESTSPLISPKAGPTIDLAVGRLGFILRQCCVYRWAAWLLGFGRILARHVDRCLAPLGAAVGSGVVRGVERPVLAGGARAPRGSIVRPGGGYHRDGELVARRAGCADHWSPRRDGQLVGGRGRVVGGPTGDRTRGRGLGMDHRRAGCALPQAEPGIDELGPSGSHRPWNG